jgi:Contractile injection system tube protein/LysM domain
MAQKLPPPTGFERANLEIEGGGRIKCWFNPKEYTIAKQNQWKIDPVVGTALPTAQFGGGQPRKLTLDLMFDASDSSLDVRTVTDQLFKAMEINTALGSGKGKNSGRPPMITFTWGSTVTFKAVADSLSVQYLLFRPDGGPIRAQAKLSLIQVEKAQDKSSGKGGGKGDNNPTTRALPGSGSHVVRDGDSLPSIAYTHYRNATRWRVIAEANGIDDPLRLRRGTTLAVPRIEE